MSIDARAKIKQTGPRSYEVNISHGSPDAPDWIRLEKERGWFVWRPTKRSAKRAAERVARRKLARHNRDTAYETWEIQP
jgi:hypothetical protein